MDKRDRAELFRERLLATMNFADLSRSALARATRVDRSTIGQLLNADLPRLPNGQLLADIAAVLGVSADFLLGLTNLPERPGDIIAAAMALSPAERLSADEQLLTWHIETKGQKIRHVPATLPDVLKTQRMMEWEYASFHDNHLPKAISAVSDQFELLQAGAFDYEICVPMHEIRACAQGVGYYESLSPSIRREQLQNIATTCRDLFPRLRMFLFDARTEFSAPVTVFGPNLAVIYIGQCYLAFRETARIQSLANHFDWLVREARVDARDLSDYIDRLLDA